MRNERLPDFVWRTFRSSLVMIAVCALPSLTFAANLIKNGGFEKPVVPVGSFVLFSTGQTIPHWTVVGAPGNIAVVNNKFTQFGFTFPSFGKQGVDLTGTSNTPTGLAQTVTTTPGAAYTLTFYVGNVVDPGGPFGTTSTVNVLVNGAQVFTATNSQGQGMTRLVSQKFTTTITATSTQTTIAFINGDPPNDSCNGLDKISLVPQVP